MEVRSAGYLLTGPHKFEKIFSCLFFSRKLADVRRCPLEIRKCPCLCQSLWTFVDIFPHQLGLSFCGRPQL